MYRALSIDDLSRELGKVTSRSDARALLNRAARVAGVAPHRPLDLKELLMVCQSLAAEGGAIQTVADQIAVSSLNEQRARGLEDAPPTD
jgi:hypothetical protein